MGSSKLHTPLFSTVTLNIFFKETAIALAYYNVLLLRSSTMKQYQIIGIVSCLGAENYHLIEIKIYCRPCYTPLLKLKLQCLIISSAVVAINVSNHCWSTILRMKCLIISHIYLITIYSFCVSLHFYIYTSSGGFQEKSGK